MQILRRRLSRNLEGDKENIVNEYITKEVLTKEECDEVADYFDDDYEAEYDAGIFRDMNGALFSLNLDRLTETLKALCSDEESPEIFKTILKKIKDLHQYELWLE